MTTTTTSVSANLSNTNVDTVVSNTDNNIKDKLFLVTKKFNTTSVDICIGSKYKSASRFALHKDLYDKVVVLVMTGNENSAISILMNIEIHLSNETATILVESIKNPDLF